MTLLLTRADLRPLLSEPELVAQGLDVIARSLIDRPGPRHDTSWLAFPLAEGDTRLNVNVLTTTLGSALRLWPTDRATAEEHAVSLLLDTSAGRLLAIMGGNYLMWRTAGAVVLACRELAPPGAHTLAMLGTGEQARLHLIGLPAAVPTLREILVHSRDPANRQRFAEHAAEVTGLAVRPVAQARDAVTGADIVCNTAGSVAPVLDPAWVRPGALVTEIFLGVPRNLPARTIVPTGAPLASRPSGWPPHPEAAGRRERVPDTSLADVLRGRAPARGHTPPTGV
jgi:ornithine cyclodeaminase/alanine dehydrogenase-like protein (mu-crystallin family)